MSQKVIFESLSREPVPYDKIKAIIKAKVGSNDQASIEGLTQAFELLPLEYIQAARDKRLGEVFSLLIEKQRIDALEKFVKFETSISENYGKEMTSTNPIDHPIKYFSGLNTVVAASQAL